MKFHFWMQDKTIDAQSIRKKIGHAQHDFKGVQNVFLPIKLAASRVVI